ncbi:HupE/UreJ family protein [Haloferula sp.]|uniref:HupE/UreJ family protein n=1 Tax=Haloferula sp. TaxID=2497595 RepID=UPI003C76E8ED
MHRLLALVFLVMVPMARAHQIAEMTLRIDAADGQFRAVVEADAAYMLPEFRGDEEMAAQDLAWLRQLGESEWKRIRRETEIYLRECLSIRSERGPIPWSLTVPDFDRGPPSFLTEGVAEMPPMIDVEIDGPFEDDTLSIEWKEPFGVVLIVQSDEETIPIISGYSEQVLQRSEEGAVEVTTPTLAGWIHLGFRHIIPDGLDHVVFIVGIFLLLPQWKPLLAQSLVFTLAHSITLAMAALGWVQLPDLWVELAIAASIVWIGIENLWLKKVGSSRYVVIALFGLIHGLGFARMLAPLLPVDRPGSLVFGVAGFNIGVELGQLLVLAVAFGLFGWWKKEAFRWVRIIGSILVACTGLMMFAERVLAS